MYFIALLIFLVFAAYFGISELLPTYYWFESFGYGATYLIQIGYKTGLFFAFAFSIFLIYFLNDRITKTNKRTGKKLLEYSIMMDSFFPCALFFAK